MYIVRNCVLKRKLIVLVLPSSVLFCQEPGEEPHDFCMALAGITLDTAAKETKRELAIKLSSDEKEKLFLEVIIFNMQRLRFQLLGL